MRPARQADCHPHRRHEAHGLCAACYDRKRLARGPRRPRWTPDDDRALAIAWPSGGPRAAAEALGRSVASCALRARALGLPPPAPGCLSLRAFANASGYTYERCARAAVTLGIRLLEAPLASGGRTPGASRRVVSPADQERLVAYLTGPQPKRRGCPPGPQTPRWQWGTGKKPPACVRCGRTDRPHRARGHCQTCAGAISRRVPEAGPFDPRAAEGAPPAAIARRLRVAKASAPDVSAAVVEAFDDASRAGHKREWLPDGYLIRKGAA